MLNWLKLHRAKVKLSNDIEKYTVNESLTVCHAITCFFCFFLNHQCCILVNLSVFLFVVCASLLNMIHSRLKDVHKRSLYITNKEEMW